MRGFMGSWRGMRGGWRSILRWSGWWSGCWNIWGWGRMWLVWWEMTGIASAEADPTKLPSLEGIRREHGHACATLRDRRRRRAWPWHPTPDVNQEKSAIRKIRLPDESVMMSFTITW